MRDAAESGRWRGFVRAFLAALLVCGPAVLVLGRLPAAAGCRPTATPDTFVAECSGTGDYEHPAYALGLEPAATSALGRAQVVLLGNSRAQFAFSTQALSRRFADRGVAAYRLGFGYGEGSPFALEVMARAGARPRLVVVNADPFFTDKLSLPAARLRDEPWRALVAALRLKAALDLRAAICGRVTLPRLCAGTRSAVHRVRADGAWAWQDSFRTRGRATAIDATPGPRLDLAPLAAERARAFLAELDLPPRCLVLTAVPNSEVDAAHAATDLAATLGARLALPRLSGLRTIDGSHLDAESAERWSRALLDALEPGLDACL